MFIGYKTSTYLYGIIGLLGIIGFFYFLFQKQYLLVLISAAIAYVSYDNFFCSDRAKKCGYKVSGHYTTPPFLKKK